MVLDLNSRSKRSYHTDIQLMVQLNILPEHLLKDIPRSTVSDFKRRDFSHIFGVEYIKLLKDAENLIIAYNESKRLRKVCDTILNIRNVTIEIISSFNKFDLNKIPLKIKEKIISVIESSKSVIGLEKVLEEFSIFKLSKNKYYQWCSELKFQCVDSLFKICKKVSPSQLTSKEVKTIKNALSSDFYKGWPIYSIAMHHIKSKKLFASVSTWYKYSKSLGIKRKKARNRRKKNKVGIRASKPQEIWHIDVTYFELMNKTKAFIYLLMDNFSRYILGWDASLELSGKRTLNLIKFVFEHFIKNNCENNSVVLLSDGGPENNNKFVDGFLSNDHVNIKKVIAQKDISFSNSMVEAVNKIIKYQYLYLHDIPDIESLRKHLEQYVPIYNEVRPHYSLNGLAPFEALNSIELDENVISKGFEKAKKRRILINRQHSCGVC